MNHSYLVPIYTQNTYFFAYNGLKELSFTFNTVVWLSKHHSYLLSYFETSKYITQYLAWCFFTSKYIIPAVSCNLPYLLFDIVQKRNSYLSIPTLTSKNISSTLFVVRFCLNMFALPICGIFTWKCINHSYLVLVHTANKQGYLVCLIIKPLET